MYDKLIAMHLADDLQQKGMLKTSSIIEAFRRIDRADFMREDLRPLAYVDEAFPLLEDQTISQPATVAFMLELLQPKRGEHILDVGFGSGWQTALLASIVGPKGHIYAVEIKKKLYNLGRENIAKYSFIERDTISTYQRNGFTGLPKIAKKIQGFDRIIAAASGSGIPAAWKQQLKIGGKLVMPVRDSIILLERKGENSYEHLTFPGFVFVPLIESQRMKNSRRKKFITTIAGLLLGAVALSAYAVTPPVSEFPKEIAIEPNTSTRQIAAMLKQAGVVRSESMLLAYLFVHDALDRVQSGTYFFERQYSLAEVASLLIDPATPKVVKVRIQEGTTLRTLAAEFEKLGLFSKEEFWSVTGLPAVEYPDAAANHLQYLNNLQNQFTLLSDKPAEAGLEGYLFPDTYEFFDGASPQEVVFKMIDTFQKKLIAEGLYEEIRKQKRNIYEVLTIASLLEREAIEYEDKTIIAGIIQNRIEKDLPLQLDASLMYVTGRGSSLLTKNDLSMESPYNTYKIKGLPLGPIANSSLESIKAALNPKKTNYLYYLSDSNYNIYYSASYDQHLEKKALYIGS